jgi:hypothetical protein
MFVRYETHIESPFEDALEVFASPAHSWVPDLTVDPGGGNVFVRSELGTAFVAKEVKMYAREAFVRPDRAVIPLRVVASGASGLFPELDADLELLPDGEDGCKLVLQGTYRLPLGHVGELLDRKLLHGLREASLKNFVQRVADILGGRPVPV